MKYKFLLGFGLLLACNRQETETKVVEPTLQSAYAHFGMTSITPDVTALKNALEGQQLYLKVRNELDFSKVETLSSINENILIFIIGMKQKDRFYAVRAIRSKVLIVQDELLYTGKMRDDKNGTIGLMRNGEALSIEFKNGQRRIKSLSEPEYKAQFAKLNTLVGFCQREHSQTYGECFNHGTEEFCDSFWSCVALNTNPQVVILIGLSCTCNADVSKPVNLNKLDTSLWYRGIDPSLTFDTLPPTEQLDK